MKINIVTGAFLLVIANTGYAQTINQTGTETVGAGNAVAETPQEASVDGGAAGKVVTGSSSDWVGQLGLGVGIGVNMLGEADISDATEVNGAIHVNGRDSAKIQLWLESHYLFGGEFRANKCKLDECQIRDAEGDITKPKKGAIFFTDRHVYHGPFFAVQVSDGDSLLQGAALGYMLAFKKVGQKSSDNPNPTPRFFNLGVGVSTSKIKTLGAGQVDGMPITAPTQIVYATKNQTGVLVIFSVGVF